jgi:lysophospholipase L1-like esterase
VVVGDSLGAGLGDSVPGLDLVGWVDRLALALRSHYPDVCIANLARSGLTTTEIIRTQLDRALALRPHLIIVTAGVNDLLARTWDPDTFRLAYGALLDGLLAGGATVLTTTWHNVPLAVPMPPALARRFSRRIGEASSIVRQVSRELGAPCLDFWHMPDLLDAECYSGDGIHPNARGYLRVAEVIADGVGRHPGMPVPHGALRSLPVHRLVNSAPSHIARAPRGARPPEREVQSSPPHKPLNKGVPLQATNGGVVRSSHQANPRLGQDVARQVQLPA